MRVGVFFDSHAAYHTLYRFFIAGAEPPWVEWLDAALRPNKRLVEYSGRRRVPTLGNLLNIVVQSLETNAYTPKKLLTKNIIYNII